MKELLDILSEVREYIEGDWFLGDGGLLGVIREGRLIKHDTDLDIYLLPNAKINIPENSHLKIQNYYMDRKLYDDRNPPNKLNKWLEYTSFIRTQNLHLNRPQFCKLASESYKQKGIKPVFTKYSVDIYQLKINNGVYVYDHWPNFFFKKDEVEHLQTNNSLGFEIKIPNNAVNKLKRQYGEEWNILDKDFKYN